jgi:hypothetical protein
VCSRQSWLCQGFCNIAIFSAPGSLPKQNTTGTKNKNKQTKQNFKTFSVLFGEISYLFLNLFSFFF